MYVHVRLTITKTRSLYVYLYTYMYILNKCRVVAMDVLSFMPFIVYVAFGVYTVGGTTITHKLFHQEREKDEVYSSEWRSD